MEQSIALKNTQSLERAVALQDELERLIAQAKRRAAETPQPINIQINLSDELDRSRYRHHEGGYGLLRSKLFLAVLVLAVTVGSAYARTHYVCQTFKQTNKFYYGMSIDRCVGTLIEVPLASMEQQLAKLNASY